MKFKTQNSKISGKGNFAAENIKKGETIWLLRGVQATLAEIEDQIARGTLRNDDPLQIGDDLFLILERRSYLFNHSCNPNAGVRNVSELFALRNIKKGEEITYDYSTVEGANITWDMWHMSCACGSSICRKEIGNVTTLPSEIVQRYAKLGAFPDFIKAHLMNVAMRVKH